MKAIAKLALTFVGVSMLSACAPAVRTYVDPQYRHATYDTVHRLAQPIPVKVGVRFEVNGAPRPEADASLKSQVEQTLRSSGVFIPSDLAGTTSEITVLANDLADTGLARAKGFGTGMTFGAVGSAVPDDYEFDIAYRDGGTTKYKNTYKHRLITIIGNVNGPASATPMTLEGGSHQVIEDTMLNFINDMQDKGVIAK